MIRNFTTIEELNLFYSEKLMELGLVSKNVNDEVLKKFVSELIEDYERNLKLLNLDHRFRERIYKKAKRMEQRLEVLDTKFELRKKKHLWWSKWKNNRKLFKIYKKQCEVFGTKEVEAENINLEALKQVNAENLIENRNPVCTRLEPAHIGSEGFVEENNIFDEPNILNHEIHDKKSEE